MTTPSSIPTDVYIAGSTGQTKIHDFNPEENHGKYMRIKFQQ